MKRQYALLAAALGALIAMMLAPSAMISQPYYDSGNARKIFGRAISPAAPTDGQVLSWVAATKRWTPGAGGGGGGGGGRFYRWMTLTTASSLAPGPPPSLAA